MPARLELPADAFAVVMATGILAIAAGDHGYEVIDLLLTVLAVLAFVVLVLLTIGQLLIAPVRTARRAQCPDVVLSAFTFVAACTVLGSHLTQHGVLVQVLTAAATLGWLVLTPLAVRDLSSRALGELREHAHGG